MALVNYSDSEGSDDDDDRPQPTPKPAPAKSTSLPTSQFTIDRANPQKIRVQLNDTRQTNGTHEDEPAAKRLRTGGSGFSGFNAMLPPPKRDAEKAHTSASKAPARKVFSLKTGAEPGFSRDSDAELRQLFADQDSMRGQRRTDEDGGDGGDGGDDGGLPNIPKKQVTNLQKPNFESHKANAFMFKPLSVARNVKSKKRPTNGLSKSSTTAPVVSNPESEARTSAQHPEPPPKKINLFSSGETIELPEHLSDELVDPDDPDDIYEDNTNFPDEISAPTSNTTRDESQNLSSIAADLNLSASDRRQLFGRSRQGVSTTAINITNFNTDQEYALNQELIASGEQQTQQHNPVRAIAPGKHSLRQLINTAQGQKDALEESFATGKRNKKEAGSKYGW